METLDLEKQEKFAEETITAIIDDIGEWFRSELSKSDSYQALLTNSKDTLKQLILGLVIYIGKEQKHAKEARVLLANLLKSNQQYNEQEWIALFSLLEQYAVNIRYNSSRRDFIFTDAVKQLENYLKKNKLTDELKNFIIQLMSSDLLNEVAGIEDYMQITWQRKISQILQKLHTIVDDDTVPYRYTLFADTYFYQELDEDNINKHVNKMIADNNNANTNAFHKILFLASEAKASKPTQKFIKEVEKNLNAINRESYRKFVQDILIFACNKGLMGNHDYYYDAKLFDDVSSQFFKGIIWTSSVFSDKKTIKLLGQLLEKSYEKIAGVGPQAPAIGNACAYALGNMRGKDGLGELSRVKLKLKQNNIKKLIDKYLDEGAKKYNISVEELKEMAVPDFHLVDGQKTLDFADYQLTIAIENSKVTQTWTNPEGKTIKNVPSVVKNTAKLTQKLKEVRKEVKDIQKTYTAQKQRIDNQFILNRQWDLTSFQQYYLNHGVVAPIAKRLIWQFTQKNGDVISGLFNQQSNAWQDVQGNEICIKNAQSVALWHPVFVDESEVVAWRDRIMDIECKQPIKQAFRELYLLTDAEITTKTYSNRMASHLLKQHQFKTLAVLRDWKYSLLGAYDDGRDNETCSKFLAEYGMTAEFWIDELQNYDDEAWNDAGIWLYVATDQVKFKNAQGETLDLVDIPKIVFSEIMRDVDLFVGVSSVGNDPTWSDNNGERRNRYNYWQSYSFGNLSEVAKTRKAVLQRLLPRLTKLKGKAKIDGNFLVVTGSIRSYKIHIGSGNILMEPNDQYLCIVPARNSDKTTDKLFIPFEGDNGLSIVLSKAFMLTEDKKIKDETITSQINRG